MVGRYVIKGAPAPYFQVTNAEPSRLYDACFYTACSARGGWLRLKTTNFTEARPSKFVQALDPNGDTPRKFEIGFRARGNRSDLAADLQIMLCVHEHLMEDKDKKKKSAVSLAGETFHLSRKGVFEALRRAEERLKKTWALEKRL